MLRLVKLLLVPVIRFFSSRRDLLLENLALRQQLAVLKRRHSHPRLAVTDRLFWVMLRQFWSGWRQALILVQPETVVRWHRAGFGLYWTWLSRHRVRAGRKCVSKELRELIFRMVGENPTWGAPRIHGELKMLGFDISERTVLRWMRKAPRNSDPAKRWAAFLSNHREAIAAMDFRVEEIPAGCRLPLGCFHRFRFRCPFRFTVASQDSPPSQTPPCRFPAAGSSSRTPPLSPGMHDSGWQQGKLTQKSFILLPRHLRPTSTATEPRTPDMPNLPIELPDARVIRWAPVILVVAPKFGVEGLLLHAHRVVPVLLAPLGDRLQAPTEPFAHRPHAHCEFPSSAACGDVRKPKEVKCGRFLPLPLCVSYGLSPKFHQPRLLRVKRQPIAGEPLGQYTLHLFRVLSVLEAQYGSSRPGELQPQALTDSGLERLRSSGSYRPVAARRNNGQ